MRGGESIELTPFQKALLQAAQERFEAALEEEKTAQDKTEEASSLWINWSAHAVYLSQHQGCFRFPCASEKHRAAVIRYLEKQQYKILP
jgi:hypothetical protein